MNLDAAASGYPDAPRYAGFWIRLAANVMDALLVSAINMAAVMLTSTTPVTARSPDLQLGPAIAPLLVIGCWIAWAATPGKMIFGLRIIDSRTAGRPSVWQCIGRYVMALVSVACAGLGYVWIALDARNQAWHDKVVGTVVIRTRG
jgi:uncharacterized RDD family membrane protein YckC